MVLADKQRIRQTHRPPGEVLFTVLTSLKYSERGGRQHLSQTLDVGNVLLLSRKYVNYLIKTEKTGSQRLSEPLSGGGSLPAVPD